MIPYSLAVGEKNRCFLFEHYEIIKNEKKTKNEIY